MRLVELLLKCLIGLTCWLKSDKRSKWLGAIARNDYMTEYRFPDYKGKLYKPNTRSLTARTP